MHFSHIFGLFKAWWRPFKIIIIGPRTVLRQLKKESFFVDCDFIAKELFLPIGNGPTERPDLFVVNHKAQTVLGYLLLRTVNRNDLKKQTTIKRFLKDYRFGFKSYKLFMFLACNADFNLKCFFITKFNNSGSATLIDWLRLIRSLIFNFYKGP